MTNFTDNLGVTIQPTDTVRVTSWGYGARLGDVGVSSAVVRFNRSTVTIIDRDYAERNVGTKCLQVLRRDGEQGYEGNLHSCFGRIFTGHPANQARSACKGCQAERMARFDEAHRS
jgi:hypothetical protein